MNQTFLHVRTKFVAAGCALLLASCASVPQLPDLDTTKLASDFRGKIVYLRSSLHVMPFFSDSSKKLASIYPPDSVELLNDTQGKVILPGPSAGLLPLGTMVRLEKVEFPSAWTMARRPLYSPRSNPWIYFSVVKKNSPAYVAVLRLGIKNREEFYAEMNEFFSDDEPTPMLNRYPLEIRKAIEEKRLVPDMEPPAVAWAWGRPERIRKEYLGHTREKIEVWTWPLHKRTATFRNDKLIRSNPPWEKTAP